MTIIVTLSRATFEITPDDDPTRVNVLVRIKPDSDAVPLAECAAYQRHVAGLETLNVRLQLQQMCLLRRIDRHTSRPLRALWLCCFLAPPPFMARLQLQAAALSARDPLGGDIHRALKRAAWAAGWGPRGSGRLKKTASLTTI
jgi:hypothetical protein